jgi:hypothetical protein
MYVGPPPLCDSEVNLNLLIYELQALCHVWDFEDLPFQHLSSDLCAQYRKAFPKPVKDPQFRAAGLTDPSIGISFLRSYIKVRTATFCWDLPSEWYGHKTFLRTHVKVLQDDFHITLDVKYVDLHAWESLLKCLPKVKKSFFGKPHLSKDYFDPSEFAILILKDFLGNPWDPFDVKPRAIQLYGMLPYPSTLVFIKDVTGLDLNTGGELSVVPQVKSGSLTVIP